MVKSIRKLLLNDALNKKNSETIILEGLQQGQITVDNPSRGPSPFHLAVFMGYFELAKYMLENNLADPNLLSAGSAYYASGDKNVILPDLYPLAIAASNGNIEMMRLLLDYNANITPFINDSHEPAMEKACLRGSFEATQLLFEHGAKSLPIVKACIGGNPEIVKLLLERGASIETSYQHVVRAPDPGTVMSGGYDGIYEHYSLVHASLHYKRPDVTELLLDRAPNPNIFLKDDMPNIVKHAIICGDFEAAKRLLPTKAPLLDKPTIFGVLTAAPIVSILEKSATNANDKALMLQASDVQELISDIAEINPFTPAFEFFAQKLRDAIRYNKLSPDQKSAIHGFLSEEAVRTKFYELYTAALEKVETLAETHRLSSTYTREAGHKIEVIALTPLSTKSSALDY